MIDDIFLANCELRPSENPIPGNAGELCKMHADLFVAGGSKRQVYSVLGAPQRRRHGNGNYIPLPLFFASVLLFFQLP